MMKSRAFTLFTTAIFCALPVSSGFAQNSQNHNQPPSYQVITLGTPLGGAFAIGMSVNARGWVGGYGNLATNAAQHAVLWRSGSAKDLGTLGGPNSALYGTYSGFAETSKTDPLGQDFCAYGDYLICLPFVLGFDSLIPLPTLGGNSAVAYWNNNVGQTVGVSLSAEQDPGCLVNGQPQPPFYLFQASLPAIWEYGRVRTVPLLSGDSAGEISGINDFGETVGFSGDCLDISLHAWLSKNGKTINLGSLGGVLGSTAASINNFGEVTGNSDLAGDATYHAFLWRNGEMTDLGTLPGDYSSYGNSINDLGQIVGDSCDINDNCRPFLWENGTMTDLNTLIPANSSLYLLDASTINDLGEIVGYAADQTTATYPAFLAIASHGKNFGQAAAVQADSLAGVALPAGVRLAARGRLQRDRFRSRPNQPRPHDD
jgi:probable HAF family extracellular repeat protein